MPKLTDAYLDKLDALMHEHVVGLDTEVVHYTRHDHIAWAVAESVIKTYVEAGELGPAIPFAVLVTHSRYGTAVSFVNSSQATLAACSHPGEIEFGLAHSVVRAALKLYRVPMPDVETA